MVKNKPNLYPKGLVWIKTNNGTFDCIGKIKSYDVGYYCNRTDEIKGYYLVDVRKYTKGNFSMKVQKYYIDEIKDIVFGKLNNEVITLLYTGD